MSSDSPAAMIPNETPGFRGANPWLFKLEALCLWLAGAGGLFTIGHAVAVELDSNLLGFLASDMLFLIMVSICTAGPAPTYRVRR